jgi:hypothetical protein
MGIYLFHMENDIDKFIVVNNKLINRTLYKYTLKQYNFKFVFLTIIFQRFGAMYRF